MTYYHATTVTSRSSGVMTLQTIYRNKRSLKSFRSMKWHKVKGKVKWWKILSKMALTKEIDNMNKTHRSFQHRTIYVFLFYLSNWLIEKIIVTICSIKISIEFLIPVSLNICYIKQILIFSFSEIWNVWFYNNQIDADLGVLLGYSH